MSPDKQLRLRLPNGVRHRIQNLMQLSGETSLPTAVGVQATRGVTLSEIEWLALRTAAIHGADAELTIQVNFHGSPEAVAAAREAWSEAEQSGLTTDEQARVGAVHADAQRANYGFRQRLMDQPELKV